MSKELELWNFVAERLLRDEHVMLLVVAESSGSSPGRQGYKMAVGADGELCGSIGGGVMEIRLVEQARSILSEPPAVAGGLSSFSWNRFTEKTLPNASGMICSGRQTVILKQLILQDLAVVNDILAALTDRQPAVLTISSGGFSLDHLDERSKISILKFERRSDGDFSYQERLGKKNDLYIIGGGHCSLALSELASKMDFSIKIFDDRPELNTIEKNRFADELTVIETYEAIDTHIADGDHSYVVVMTVGYASDEVVIKKLFDKDLKYLGVLGSKAKMVTLLKQLQDEGYPAERLERIRTPIGLSINSRTPEEIAVSIMAEIIAVKNR